MTSGLFWCPSCDGYGWDDDGYICDRCGGMGVVCHRPHKPLTLHDIDRAYWPCSGSSDVQIYDFATLDEGCALVKSNAFEVAMIQAAFAFTGALEEF